MANNGPQISTIKEIIQTVIDANDQVAMKASLEAFVEQASHLYKFAVLNDGLMPAFFDKLYEWITDRSAPEVQLLCLDVLRLLTRDCREFDLLLTEERIHLLLSFANVLDDDNIVVDTDYKTVAALKCLYNIIYSSKNGCHIFIEQNCIERILYRAEHSDSKLMSQIKLFDMKVLFLVSAICKDVRDTMKEKHGIKYLINKLEYVQHSTKTSLSTPEVQVFSEILKILFNLSLSITEDKEDEDSCLRLVKSLRRLLLANVLNDEMKLEMHSNVINLLTNMPYSSFRALITAVPRNDSMKDFYKFENYNMRSIYNMLEFLKNSIDNSAEKPEELAPILTVLLRTATAVSVIRKYLRARILPPLRDVHKRPEDGDTLRNKLCRLLTSPISNVSDLTANLLFVLCKENVARMVKHTGYGNAAGLLAQRGLLAGGSSGRRYSDSEDSDTEEYKQHKNSINPIVGYCEPPHPDPVANMTEDQKEYEVMKLVNLMDNLTRRGIVKPCTIGPDGKLQPVEHILKLQEAALPAQQLLPIKKE